MFVNSSRSISFFSPASDFIRQDRVKVVVSCVAIGILLVGAIYWVASHFWQKRRVTLKDSALVKVVDASSNKQKEMEDNNGKLETQGKRQDQSVIAKAEEEILMKEDDLDGSNQLDDEGTVPSEEELSAVLDEYLSGYFNKEEGC